MKKVLFSGIILCLPLKQLTVTSSYGYRLHPVTRQYAFHSGIDLRAMHDTIYAVMGGVVKAVRFQAHIGVFVRLDHGGFESEYGHLSQVFSIPGDTVAAGSPLGISGATGRVTGEHLHFGIRVEDHYTDPLNFLYQLMEHYLNQRDHE